MSKAVKKYKGELKHSNITVRICARCHRETITRPTLVRKQIDRKMRVEDICFTCIPMGATPGVKVITRLADGTDIKQLDDKLTSIEELIYKLGDALEPKRKKRKKK